MPKKLTGMLRLSRILKSAIRETERGEKFIWVDIVPLKQPDQYGNTHTLTMYDKENNKTIYLADLKTKEFGTASTATAPTAAPAAAPAAPKVEPEADDLPF